MIPFSAQVVSTLIAVIFLWGFVLWGLLEPKYMNSQVQEWKSWISNNFSWFYIASFVSSTPAFLFAIHDGVRSPLRPTFTRARIKIATWLSLLYLELCSDFPDLDRSKTKINKIIQPPFSSLSIPSSLVF